MGDLIGIDYGTRRVGFAVGDLITGMAFPHGMEEVTNPKQALQAALRVCRARNPEQVVVGLPLRTDGKESEMAAVVRKFALDLERQLKVPVVTWDERYTTTSANQVLIQSDVRRDKRKMLVDQLAAQIMLQSYIDSKTSILPPDELE